MADKPYDPAVDGALMSLKGDLSYGDYLRLEDLLNAQQLQSSAHDEMLFIIQHQTSELWMRLIIHELQAARVAIGAAKMSQAFKMLARVSRIFEQLNNAWDVLRTMTPSEYTEFREKLGPSSGFQSYQYRQIEFMLGNRNPHMLKPHEHTAQVHNLLLEELDQPSLYAVAVNLLYATLDGEEAAVPKISKRRAHQADADILQHWKVVYENVADYWSLYELAEKLVDLEDYFRRWRFNHVTTVERVIGFKRGTGGTAGVSYLRRMLSVELFPELWHVRGEL